MCPSRRALLKAAGYGIVGLGLSALGGYGYLTSLEPGWLQVEHVAVRLNIPSALEGVKIVQLSDLHLYPFTQLRLIRRAVALANDLHPDLVLLTGDYVDGDAAAIDDLVPVLAGLNPRLGIYAVLGNHDLWTLPGVIREALQRAGIPVLVNQGLTVQIRGELVGIAGLDDGWSGSPDLRTALEGIPPQVPVLLMMHEPDLADGLSLDGRVSLQLSGHSHGGQVRLPGRGALILPYLGRKYDAGLYRVRGMWLYTSRGIGVVAPPVRFNCRPEVTQITLTARR